MHPISTLLLLVGYGLAIPLLLRARTLTGRFRRLGLVGHQLGVLVAALGWAVRSRPVLAVAHLVWAMVARAVVGFVQRRRDGRPA